MSSQRLSRKEIKHEIREDAFRQAVGDSYGYVLRHRRNLLLAIGGVLLLIAAIVGWRIWSGKRETAASITGQGDRAYYARCGHRARRDPDSPASPTRRASRRAPSSSSNDRADYSVTAAGRWRGIIAAFCCRRTTPRAREYLCRFLEPTRPMLASACGAGCLPRPPGGKGEQVCSGCAPTSRRRKPLPEDVILFELGVTLEQLGRRQEAHDAFQVVLRSTRFRLGFQARPGPRAGAATGVADPLAPLRDPEPQRAGDPRRPPPARVVGRPVGAARAQLGAFLMRGHPRLDREDPHPPPPCSSPARAGSWSRQVPRCCDKHSTGGRLRISLAVAPLLAACGLPVVMLTGRALVHTGAATSSCIPGCARLDRAAPAAFAETGIAIVLATRQHRARRPAVRAARPAPPYPRCR